MSVFRTQRVRKWKTMAMRGREPADIMGTQKTKRARPNVGRFNAGMPNCCGRKGSLQVSENGLELVLEGHGGE